MIEWPSHNIGIIATPNTSAGEQLRRIGKACLERGLAVTYYIFSLGAGYTADGHAYQIDGAVVRSVDLPNRFLGYRYPSPIALLRMESSVFRALAAFRPSCVVSHIDSFGIHRLVHRWALLNRVPGVVVQEGMSVVSKSNPRKESSWLTIDRVLSLVMRGARRSYMLPGDLNMYAQYVCVWGEAMRQQLITQGRLIDSIVVTGSPVFDHVTRQQPLRTNTAHAVLYADQPLRDSTAQRQFYRLLLRTCLDDINCRLIFKTHPRSSLSVEDIRSLAMLETKQIDGLTVVDTGDVAELLDHASVFVTHYSTSAYQALLAGLPLVLIDYVNTKFRLDTARYDAALVVNDAEELGNALRLALYDNMKRQRVHDGGAAMIKDHLYKLDACASQRIAEFLRKLVRNEALELDMPERL